LVSFWYIFVVSGNYQHRKSEPCFQHDILRPYSQQNAILRGMGEMRVARWVRYKVNSEVHGVWSTTWNDTWMCCAHWPICTFDRSRCAIGWSCYASGGSPDSASISWSCSNQLVVQWTA